MMRINCDIGERGADHVIDRQLMEVIHIANLACGGHAGDRASVEAFRELAGRNGVAVAAHLSYPDRSGFGRRTVSLPAARLIAVLEEQLALLPGVRAIKFHGALYNDSCRDRGLAVCLADWLAAAGVRQVLAPADSELAAEAGRRGIAVLREAFADRRYAIDHRSRRLVLVDRSQPQAVIGDLDAALAQAGEIVLRGRVDSRPGPPGRPQWRPIAADTLCVHSDSPIALELARGLRRLVETR